MGLHRVPRVLCVWLFAVVAGRVSAQDLTPGLTYVCSGERLFIENCNMRDLSDRASCMVGHPDHILANGLMQYSNMTRGALKQLFPSCQQPSAKQSAAAHAFQQKQQATYDANVQKANSQLEALEHAPLPGQAAQKPRSPEERATNRCITSGRLPSSCTGNALLGAFGSMLSSVLPSGGPTTATAGPVMAGVFEDASWRLDFIDGGVLVNCATLSPNQESYTLDFRPTGAVLTIHTRPKPLVLAVHGDGTITGPGPVIIDGVVAGGYTPGSSTAGHNETSSYTTTERMNANQVQPASGNTTNTYAGGGAYDVTTTHTSNNYVGGSSTPGYTNFVPRRATCPALRLSSRGAPGMQTMQTDLLKSMLGGDKGPPTPAGIRMHGIYAAETGFSLEFFPESVIVGCGPDAARAYPYTVNSTGGRAAIQIAAADHPLIATLSASGSLEVGTGPYQVHGRRVIGENDNGDFTFAPNEQTCSLATLVAAKSIPSGGGTAATTVASAAAPSNPSHYGGTLSTPAAPLGNATLTIVSGLPAQAGAPSPLAGHPVVLLRTSYAESLSRGGVPVPAGTSPYKYVASTCTARTPACQKIIDAINAVSVSAARADAAGTATLPGVPPGTYYLMVSARFNNQPYTWGQPVQLKPGANSITLNSQNATPLN